MASSGTPSGPASGSSNNNSSGTPPSPPSSPPPSPPSSSPPPSPPSSPPPSPPSSPPPAPPKSPPPSPEQSSSPPPPTKEGSPASPAPPEKSNSPSSPKNSQPVPGGSPPPSPPSTLSPGTPLPPPQLVATPSPPGTTGSVLSPPVPVSESTPQTQESSTNHTTLSHSPPNAKGSSTSSSADHVSSPSSVTLSSSDIGLIAGLAAVGVFVIAFIIICVACLRRKKKQQYYSNPRPNDQFYNRPVQHHSPRPHDHVLKLSPTLGGANGWGAPPPPSSSNLSSEFNSGQNHGHLPPPSPKMAPGLGGMNQGQFTYEELVAATSGFSQSNLIGQGGFGFVHKGVLPDKREVAVKSLKSGSGQGEREFQAEVEIINRVHHRHLVSLVGYCITEKQRMLVYEFVPNKTLEFHLHGTGQPPMDWPTRLRIALGSAKGLAYLHEDCHPRIIHRDIKSANILLDANFEAMVADFGLAKLTSDNYTHVSTRVMGTFGYLAPEYAQSGKLTEKSDVFSFGVMLLEIITGRRPVDTTNRQMEDSLVDWARPLLTKALEDGNYDKLADPRMEGNYIPHEMARMVACAAASIRHSARRRPKMSQIVRSLQGDSALEELNEGGAKSGQNSAFSTTGGSIGYDTGAYNADMMKFRKMIMPSQEFTSDECGATSEYGLNPSSTSSSEDFSGPQKHKQ